MKRFIFDDTKKLLFATSEGETDKKGKEMVTLKNCFPWSEGASFFSVRNAKDDEVAFISKLNELSPSDYEAIGKYFETNCTQFKIKRIHSIEEEYDLRLFQVETQFGPRSFQMKADDWPIILSQGRILLYDISGDFYLIDEIESLTKKEQKELNYLID